MIITRTPLRISLGGGGTDLPDFYRDHGGGFLVAAAISKYVYVAAHDNFEPEILLKYSKAERVASLEDIEHPILREALRLTGIERGIEISSMADIPAGTGLGSSGSFAVGVLNALRTYQRRPLPAAHLAEEACHLEIDVLGEHVGKQDQYAAAIGGVTAFTFAADGAVTVEAVELPDEARWQFEENLLLFYTGVRRSASAELSAQTGEAASSVSWADNLRQVRDIGYESRDALQRGAMADFAQLMTRQWKLKHERSPSALHDQVDGWITAGLGAGALGGKLVGAGGGGFLLFYADHKVQLRAAMAELGLAEVRFAFDYEGTKVITS